MRLHKIKPLQTERLILRPFEQGDAQDVYDYSGDEEVVKYLSYEKHESIEESESVIRRILVYDTLAIVDKESNKVIGSFGMITDPNPHIAEVGYALNRNYWNQGYMSEVMQCMIPFIFNNTAIVQITAGTNSNNLASQAMLEKNGFILKGELKKFMMVKREEWDLKIYQILKK